MSNTEQHGDTVVACPVTIFAEGRLPFEVTDVGAWTLDAGGAVATGHWTGSFEEVCVWFPIARIQCIQYHWDQLEAWVRDQQDAKAGEDKPSLTLVSDD